MLKYVGGDMISLKLIGKSVTSELHDKLKTLKLNLQALEKTLDLWGETAECRLTGLQNADPEYKSYLDDFKVLRNPDGWRLVSQEFKADVKHLIRIYFLLCIIVVID